MRSLRLARWFPPVFGRCFCLVEHFRFYSMGDVVRGSGGVRKVRWSRRGTGKSGGVRVLYFAWTEAGQIWLLLIYAKSAVDSIPGHILKALKEEMEHATK
ncbi:MAG: hypothetical protein PHH91_12505 [Desulfuromonadaceae bacterium]|nr:hypothetical protein [Desulfuromonadaceae bacterium]